MTYADSKASPQAPADEWGIAELDLDAYLHQIGVPARPPSREALTELHRAHRRTFPFENLDVLLDQHPGVSVAAVQRKFGTSRRGGYCFEHTVLFAAALERLGYAVVRHLSRVGDPVAKPRTHLVNVVDLDGERLLCDVGLSWALLEPIPMLDRVEHDQDGWRVRLRRHVGDRGEVTWEMQRRHGQEWEGVHWIDENVVHEIDVQLAHHWTNAAPTSHFRSHLIVGGLEGDHILGISLDGVTERRPDQPTRHTPLPEDAGSLAAALARLRIHLSPTELQRLADRLNQLREPPKP